MGNNDSGQLHVIQTNMLIHASEICWHLRAGSGKQTELLWFHTWLPSYYNHLTNSSSSQFGSLSKLQDSWSLPRLWLHHCCSAPTLHLNVEPHHFLSIHLQAFTPQIYPCKMYLQGASTPNTAAITTSSSCSWHNFKQNPGVSKMVIEGPVQNLFDQIKTPIPNQLA